MDKILYWPIMIIENNPILFFAIVIIMLISFILLFINECVIKFGIIKIIKNITIKDLFLFLLYLILIPMIAAIITVIFVECWTLLLITIFITITICLMHNSPNWIIKIMNYKPFK